VRDYWEVDRREEIFLKCSLFFIVPCETCFVILNKVMHEFLLFGPKEITRMVFFNYRLSFEGISRGGDECQRMGIEFQHIFKGITNDISNYSKLIQEFGDYWSNFECNGFVLLRLDVGW
jgi:hypothetical protein